MHPRLAIVLCLALTAAAAEPKKGGKARPPKSEAAESAPATELAPAQRPAELKPAPAPPPADLKPLPEPEPEPLAAPAAVELKASAPPPSAAAVASDARPRALVLELSPQGVTAEQSSAFTDAVVASLTARGVFDVVSPRDLQTLLGAERQKQLLGICAADESKCAQDATSLVAARFVLSGQLARVGSAFQLTLQMVDTVKAQPVGRSTRLSGSFDELRALVPYAAAEATGMPLPPPPSRVLPITLLAAGGGTVFAGGVVGLLALSREAVLNEELCPGGVQTDGRCSGVGLRDRTYYQQQDQALLGQKALALGLLAAGALAVGAGFWLMPPADARASVALVPTGTGFAITGGF